MNMFIKLLMLALIAALAAPFFLAGPDGRPLWTVDDFTTDVDRARSSVQRLVRAIEDRGIGVRHRADGATRAEPDAGHTLIHRWQDASGVWHFASEPPPGVITELVQIDPDANLVQGFRAETQLTGGAAETPPSDAAVTPTTVGELVDPAQLAREAEAIREGSEARNATLEALRRDQ